MKYTFRFLLPMLTAMLFFLSGCIAEKSEAQYVEGKQYAVITNPVPTQAPAGQVEVAEVFWYGCPHCYELEPTINEYLKQKPANVYFTRVPATLGSKWTYHAKLYYVGVLLDPDGSKHVHEKIFEAMHKQGRRIDNDEAMKRFFESIGFKASDIDNAMKSMELQSLMKHADEVTRKSGVDSVPSLIVNGKYLTGPSMMTGGAKLVDVLNYLTNLK